MDYKLVIPPMTIHFCEQFPMRKKPVMAVSFEGEACQYKVASFNSKETMQWFVDCLDDALANQNVKRFPEEVKQVYNKNGYCNRFDPKKPPKEET